MLNLPANHTLVPEVYEHLPVGRMLFLGLRGELKIVHHAWRALPKTRFVIFAQGRTGSTLMTSTLDRHSAICCHDEILCLPRAFPLPFIANTARASAAPCFGFHVKIYQLLAWQRVRDAGIFLQEMHRRGWKIIYLWRENALRHVVSNVYAEASGAYYSRAGSTGAKPERVYIPLERVHHDIAMRLRMREAEKRVLGDLPYFELCYERDLENAQAQSDSFRRVQQFLGLEIEELVPELKKRVDRPLPDLIDNYAEIAAALSGTPHKRYLENA
jgi:hypothetical protein